MTLAVLEAVTRGTLDLGSFDNSPRWWIGSRIALYEAQKHRAEQQAMLRTMGIETDVNPDTITLSGDQGTELAARWYLAHEPDKLGL